MEQIIKRLIEIDQTANQMIEDAKQQKQKIANSLSADKAALREKYERLTSEKAAAYEQKRSAEIELKIEKIKTAQQKQSALLKETYLQHREEWIAEVTKRALGQVQL